MDFIATRNAGDDINVPLTINFTVGGTAIFPTDYTVSGATAFTATTGTLTIPAGQTSAQMVMTPVADTSIETDETIVLTPQAQAGVWSIGTGLPWLGTILNDDGGGGGGTDPLFADVGLLLHLDTNFTDSSSLGLTVTPVGGLVVSTAQSQWGGGSASYNGTTAEATVPNNIIFNRGAGDFCWELWINQDVGASTVRRNIFCVASGATGLSLDPDRRLTWWLDGPGNLVPGTPPQLVEGTWNYVAVNRVSGTTNIWLNNALYASFANTTAYDFRGWLLGHNQYNSRWKGYIDEVRFTKAARTITAAPAAAFPNN